MPLRNLLPGALLTVGLAAVCGSPAQEAAAPKIDLHVVKYSQLGQAVKAQKGKVVVVDVWADW